MPKHRHQQQSWACRLSGLLLVVMMSSQLSYALHQASHSLADTGETCTVCVQFERDGDAPVGDGQMPALSAAAHSGTDELAYALPADRFSHYASRASPRES